MDDEKLARRKSLNKKTIYIFGGILLLIVLFVMFTPKTYTLEQQQQAYKSWQGEFMQYSRRIDDGGKEWQRIFVDFGSGKLSRNEASSKLQQLDKTLADVQSGFGKIEVPDALSDENQKTLKSADKALSTAAFCRREAIKYAMEWLDNLNPNSQAKALEEIKSSNQYIIDGTAKMLTVSKSLKL